jgi:hypothetical protein
MQPAVLLAAGYAVLLLTVAAGLEWLARHTAARSQRYRTAGFTYRPDQDVWICPRNEPLWPAEVDRQHRVLRYRARATVCNACPDKAGCTSTHDGREIVQPIDPWPHSEAGRFHRGVSVTLAAIAGTFLGAATVAHHDPADAALTVPTAVLTGWLMWRWMRDFRRTPTGFPDARTIRHQAAAPDRTAWGFDRQPPGSPYRSGRRPGDAERPS